MHPFYKTVPNLDVARSVLPTTHTFATESDTHFGKDWLGYLYESWYDCQYKNKGDKTHPLTRQLTPVQEEYIGQPFDVKTYPIFFAKPK
jgi:hypothetical protein